MLVVVIQRVIIIRLNNKDRAGNLRELSRLRSNGFRIGNLERKLKIRVLACIQII